MIIIKIDCCGCPQTLCGLSVWTSSDAMRAKGLIWFKVTILSLVALLHYSLIQIVNITGATSYHSIIQKEVDELLANGAIKPSNGGAGFYLLVFMVPKCSCGIEPILNLK